MTDDRLAHAIQFAMSAHRGQTMKDGVTPYYLHPLAVMLDTELTSEDERIVAMLHDVVEDTHIELRVIRHEFGNVIANAVDAITKRQGEKYFDYLEKVKQNPIALKVKRADVRHNSRPDRLECIPNADEREYLQKKYKRARVLLGIED